MNAIPVLLCVWMQAAAEPQPKVAIMDLIGDSVPPAFGDSLVNTMSQTLSSMGAFQVVTSAEVRNLVNYQATRQQMGGCDSPDCLSALGDLLGTDYLVTGSLDAVTDGFLLQLQLIEVSTGSTLRRVSREYAGSQAGLFDEARAAAKLLVRELLRLRSGYLELTTTEEGATVRIDDVIVGVTPMAVMEVGGGMHTISVEKEGFIVYRADVEIPSKQVVRVMAPMLPSTEFVEAYRDRAGMFRTLSWVAMAAGGAFVVTGGVLVGMAASQNDQLNRDIDAYNRGFDRSTAEYERLGQRQQSIAMMDGGGLAAMGVGVGAVVTGILLRVMGPDPDRYQVVQQVSVGPQGAALTFTW